MSLRPLSADCFSTLGVLGKKETTINRLLPATVNLVHKRIRIESRLEGNVKQQQDLPSLLKTKLVTMIQTDPRFIIDEVHPETILKFAITNYYVEQYNSGVGTQNVISYRGKIEVAYQAADARTGVALVSENLSQTAGDSSKPCIVFGPNCHSGGSSPNATRDELVDGIVHSMGKRVAPTEEPIVVPLPVKKLESLSSRFGTTHRWGDLEEEASKMEKFPKPEDDACRLYLVALAKEAQAYDLAILANERNLGKRPEISLQDAAKEFHRAQNLMDEARKTYKDIIDADPKEKEFRPGDTRTQEAVEIYSAIARSTAQPAEAPGGSGSRSTGQPAAAGSKPSPLEQVIEFCKQGLDVTSIKEYINSQDFLESAHAASYKFSFTTDAVALKDACKQNAPAIQTLIISRLKPPAGKNLP